MPKLIKKALRFLSRALLKEDYIASSDLWLIQAKHRRKKEINRAFRQGENVYNKVTLDQRYNSCSRILDIGCGDGCVAASFKRNGHSGEFLGYDINEVQVRELNRLYEHANNFKFEFHNLKHSYYNKNLSARTPDDVSFNWGRFDIIILNSVFSHFRQNLIKDYLQKCSQSLTKYGFVWATIPVIDDNFDPSKPAEKHFQQKPLQYFESFTFSPDEPERFMAHPFSDIEKIITESGLKVETFTPGYWKDQRKSLDQAHQDLFKLVKA